MAKKKANGEGSIAYESARKKYRASITDPNGKRIVKRFNKREEASIWLTGMINSIYTNSYIPPANTTLGEWLIEWLKVYVEPNVKLKTYYIYTDTAKRIGEIANIPLQSLTATDVQKFLNNMPTRTSNNLKNKIFKLVNAALTKAYQLSIINKNCMSILTSPRPEKKEIEIFTKEDVKTIFAYLQDEKTDKRIARYYAFILFAFMSGARLGELMALQWRDINFDDNSIKIQRTTAYFPGLGMQESEPKTEAGKRKIILPARVMYELEKIKASRTLVSFDGSDYVFCSKEYKVLQTRNVHRMWKSILSGAHVNYKNFHVIRHTHATELLASGMPIIEVSRRLGHSKASVTLDMYGHAMKNYDEKLAAAIADIYAL